MLSVVFESAQEIGKRDEQQDSYGEEGLLSVVCDGMGGMPLGRESSELAVRAFIDAYQARTLAEPVGDALTRSAFAANGAVLEMAARSGCAGMAGTTLVAAVIERGSLYWISVGDSRIYLFRNGFLKTLNREHNLANRLESLARQGKPNPDEAMAYLRPDLLTSFIGIEILEEFDLPEEPLLLQGGDIVLSCTDGLYNSMIDEEIGDILLSAPGNAEKGYIAKKIVGYACGKELPFQDNITVLVMRVFEQDRAGKKKL